ncbi:MAG: class I SAM-dependent methyltransferase [Clostridiales bacterium]|nr:class I SAM-dependent methyltransferase [Clostridiales bacterium]
MIQAKRNIQNHPAAILIKDDRKKGITAYWAKRSEAFTQLRQKELHGDITRRWEEELDNYLCGMSTTAGKRILDVGCGSGFFTILLAKKGYDVTGIDLTEEMITCARKLAEKEMNNSARELTEKGWNTCTGELAEEELALKKERGRCHFAVMDAECLQYADASFDVVVSRNLTWNLPHPEQAYSEWLRVLKPGGILLNFDGDYGNEDTQDPKNLPENHAHKQIEESLLREYEKMKRQLPLNIYRRPIWDIDVLTRLGVEKFSLDMGTGTRIYTEMDEFYNPVPIFTLCAVNPF